MVYVLKSSFKLDYRTSKIKEYFRRANLNQNRALFLLAGYTVYTIYNLNLKFNYSMIYHMYMTTTLCLSGLRHPQ